MLKTTDLEFSYGGGLIGFRFPDFACAPGQHWLMLGASGCGKTTLLHLLAGLLKPTGGQIKVSGADLAQFSGSKLDRYRGQNIGIVFQGAHLIRSLNLTENLVLAGRLAGNSESELDISDTLNRLNLYHRRHASVNELSQGEKQRASIARALINKAPLILADEPTSALDDKNCYAVLDLLEEQSKLYNSTLLIVTHDQRLKDRFTHQIHL
jgi:lipoprotein-releasing system ATP-binding protein